MRSAPLLMPWFWLAGLGATVPLTQRDQPPIEYTVSLPAPQTQMVEISMLIRDVRGETLNVALPIWRPGRYNVLDPAATLREVHAADGAGTPLTIEKIRKSVWRIATRGADTVRVDYRIYANSLGDRTRHVDDTHAFLSGESVFMYPVGRRGDPIRVHINAPEGWRIACGLEFAVGIPGTVGGWIAMNAGIPDREMKDVVAELELAVPGTADPVRVDREAVQFGYRETELPEGALVLSVGFSTSSEEPGRIKEQMRPHLEYRRLTQPVDQRSCGSVFKNPPGDHAGRLIEACGPKGQKAGDAQISTVHANFIVNEGRATAADVLHLVERAQAEVLERFGVELEPEVRILGGAA